MTEKTERQMQLLQLLHAHADPLPGQTLAEQLGVTRQVIVREIALLRALGHRLLATPKGYILQSESTRRQHLLAVSHDTSQTEKELMTLVDCGIKVLDVRVEHAIYGEIVANLFLSSRRDVEHFIHKISTERAPLLSSLTGGIHYHLVEYDHDEQLQEAIDKLVTNGIRVLD